MPRLPETTRAARVLDIVWRIQQAPRYWTRRKLAQAFEISERSITADLDIIRHGLRFDLRTSRGEGYYFDSLPQLPSVSYSVNEALALILASEAGRHVSGIPQQDLSSAIARLTSVIPPELREMVHAVVNDDLGPERSHREHMLATCTQAVSTRRTMRIVYAAASRGGAKSTREVDAYAVFPYLRSWHLVGYCHLREDIRMFKIDRIKVADPLDLSFQVREDFDLAAYLSSGWGLMRGLDLPVEDVELRFSPKSARWVAEERWHASQSLNWNPDGSLSFRVAIQVTPEFKRWVFGYGREVSVVAPLSLHKWVREEASALVGDLAAVV